MNRTKEIDFNWFGTLSTNWQLFRIKDIFRIKGGNGFPDKEQGREAGELPFLKNSDINSPFYFVDSANNYLDKEDATRLKLNIIPKNSIIMGKIGESLKKNHRKINLCDCLIDNNMQALITKSDDNIKFLNYISRCIDMAWFDNGGTVPSVNNQLFLYSWLPLPPLSTQNRIVAYLDKKIAIINHQIEANKKAIDLLGEYRASEISRIVTKGLNENVELINSRNTFIGKIPKHWRIEKLKYLVELDKQRLSENTPLDYVFRYVDIGSVNLIDGITNYQEMQFSEAPSRARMIVSKNDIIVSTVRTYLKAVALIEDANNVIVSTGFAVLSPKPKKIYEKFLAYYCKSDVFCCEVESRSYGISYPAINSADLIHLKVLIPPLAEQKEIVAYLDKKCKQIDQIIAYRKAIIEKLEEYKKSLIYETVTGKKEI